MGKSWVKLCSIATVTILLHGCAFGNRQLNLEYEPVTVKASPNHIPIYVNEFIDERTDKSVIGHVRNGYGMKTAEVLTSTPIGSWVTQAFKTELENVGFTISDNPQNEIQTQGEVITVYCDSYMQYEGKIILDVVLKKGDEVILDKKYEGRGSNMNWAATSNGYASTLKQALQNAMSQLIIDIDSKL